METVLRAEGLAKTYTGDGIDVLALRGVDLEIGNGEFVAVMGPSGCGKSTLLHLLGGLDRPTAGSIELAGRRVESLSEAEWAVLRRRELGFVFQFFNLVGTLTVAENVELPALLAGVPAREARRRGAEWLQRLGLEATARRVPGDLSGGQQQRVAIARALVNRPSLLLADEPTGNLDSTAAREVMSVLRERHREGQTIVLVTHDLRVASTADRVISLRDGRIADETSVGAGEGGRDALSRVVALEA